MRARAPEIPARTSKVKDRGRRGRNNQDLLSPFPDKIRWSRQLTHPGSAMTMLGAPEKMRGVIRGVRVLEDGAVFIRWTA